jgi:hypothetical protein
LEQGSYQKKIEGLSPITFSLGPLSEEKVSAFRKATSTAHTRAIPPTFPTCFRKAEFDWLDLIKVDMRTLLHTEQEYEYLVPLQVGDTLTVTTSVESCRERRGMTFFVLLSEVSDGKAVKVRSHTTFVLRTGAK